MCEEINVVSGGETRYQDSIVIECVTIYGMWEVTNKGKPAGE